MELAAAGQRSHGDALGVGLVRTASRLTEEHCSVKDGHHLNRRLANAIDDAVVPPKNLANGGIFNLWHDATRFWKLARAFDSRDQSSNDEGGVVLRISTDE